MSGLRRSVAGLAWTVLLAFAACEPGLELPAGWQPAAPIDCRSAVTPTSVGLMQPVELELWVYVAQDGAQDGAQDTAPAWPPPPPPAGFVGSATTATARHGEGWVVRHVMRLRPTELGTVAIPSFPIEIGGHRTSTPAHTIEVTSVLGGDHDPAALEDPAAPFPPAFRWWPIAAAVGAALLLVLLFWAWRRHSRRPRSLPVEVPLPPHVKAMRALARLRQAERATAAQVEAFYVEVSQILRAYLEGRFGLHAPLRSTEEFLVEVERGDDLSRGHRQSLRQFLQQCDLVKFARLIPGPDAHEQTLRIAENFVAQTRADGVAPADEDAAQPVGGAA